MNIDPNDSIDRDFYLGCYEPHLVELIASLVQPGDICIDVGAQKGFITLHLAKSVGSMGQVLSFEPDPGAMRALRANVDQNGFDQVRLYACALGDVAGCCEFTLSHRIGWSSRFPNEVAMSVAAARVSIPTRRLDDVMSEIGISSESHRLSFLKIDAEGSEPLVLSGAEETIKRFWPTIHIEVNIGSLRAGGFSAHDIEGPLQSLEYAFYRVRLLRVSSLFQRRLSLERLDNLADIEGCEDVLAIHNSIRLPKLRGCLQEQGA